MVNSTAFTPVLDNTFSSFSLLFFLGVLLGLLLISMLKALSILEVIDIREIFFFKSFIYPGIDYCSLNIKHEKDPVPRVGHCLPVVGFLVSFIK